MLDSCQPVQNWSGSSPRGRHFVEFNQRAYSFEHVKYLWLPSNNTEAPCCHFSPCDGRGKALAGLVQLSWGTEKRVCCIVNHNLFSFRFIVSPFEKSVTLNHFCHHHPWLASNKKWLTSNYFQAHRCYARFVRGVTCLESSFCSTIIERVTWVFSSNDGRIGTSFRMISLLDC